MAQRILIVEDDDVTRELLCQALARQGYEVTTAEDGLKGYELALSQRPDLIITDIYMPAADGAHLLRQVRDTPELATTPVLVVTGYGTGGATLALSLGADAYEPKPIQPANLLATVRRLLA
jgi:two-component system, OmpR family, alkaline phosphatase synthesis response regulator PhoP